MKLRGLKELEQQLLELGTELALKTLAGAARRSFKPVLDSAKAHVPRDTGELAQSLKLAVIKPRRLGAVAVVGIRVSGRGGQARMAAAVFGHGGGPLPAARRWHFIELGTAKKAPHPYLRPALRQNAERVLSGLKTELQKGIGRALKKRGRK